MKHTYTYTMRLVQSSLFILTIFITAIVLFAQMYQFILELISFIKQKFRLTSNCLGTNTVVIKRVDYIIIRTHIRLVSFLWDNCKQRRSRSDSDQGLHCLLTEFTIKIPINMKNTSQKP